MSPINIRPKRTGKKLLIEIYMDGNIFLIDKRTKRFLSFFEEPWEPFMRQHCPGRYKNCGVSEKAVDSYPSPLKFFL